MLFPGEAHVIKVLSSARVSRNAACRLDRRARCSDALPQLDGVPQIK